MEMMHLASPELKRYVPDQQKAQISHQLLVTGTNFGVYVCASEAGVLFTLLLYCLTSIIELLQGHLGIQGNKYFVLAYADCSPVPNFTPRRGDSTLASIVPLWTALNNHVRKHGPLRPVRPFRHRMQALYSRRKGGADFSARFKSELNSSGSAPGREQKLMQFFFKTLLVNRFTAWMLL